MPPLFADAEYSIPPANDSFEIALLGPGYGECALVHLGDQNWIIVDSFVDRESQEPAALKYLSDISVPAEGVYCVVASHWDDDHIRGLSKILERCSNARFATASAFAEKDFLAFAAAYSRPFTEKQGSRVEEIFASIKLRAQDIDWATNAKTLLAQGNLSLSHRQPISIISLSPSNQETTDFLQWTASEFPERLQTRRAAPSRKRNHFSIVLIVEVGATSCLLGGDLEEPGKPNLGWSAILADAGRPARKSDVFKIAHHGSENAHHDAVWSDMLNAEALAMLAPFKNGDKHLPTKTDVDRILRFTNEAYATNGLVKQKPSKRGKAVEKTIKESGVALSSIPNQPGMVRARRPLGGGSWSIELFGAARHLKDIASAA